MFFLPAPTEWEEKQTILEGRIQSMGFYWWVSEYILISILRSSIKRLGVIMFCLLNLSLWGDNPFGYSVVGN